MSIVRRNIPNLFTAGNLVGGILAIVFTLSGKIHLAPYCIFVSAIFDFLDGFLARLLKVPSEMGKQLDSLADMVTFGVAPGIIVYELIRTHIYFEYYMQDFLPSTWRAFFPVHTNFNCDAMFYLPHGDDHFCNDHLLLSLPYLAFLIPVFALFRLAKFNLDSSQSEEFKGLPTPAMTLFFAAIPLIILGAFEGGGWKAEIANNLLLNPIFLISSTIILSVLMVLPFRMFALKFKSYGWKGNEIRYIFLTISAGLLATLFWWALPIIILLYIILSLINNLITKSTTDEIQS